MRMVSCQDIQHVVEAAHSTDLHQIEAGKFFQKERQLDDGVIIASADHHAQRFQD